MSERFRELFKRYLDQTITAVEQRELSGLMLEQSGQQQFHQLLEEAWENSGDQIDIDPERAERMLIEIMEDQESLPEGGKLRFLRRAKGWAAAACLLALISTGAYFMLRGRDGIDKPVVKNDLPVNAPSSNRATILLEDGTRLYLDSVANGKLADQHGVKLLKKGDGQVVYEGESPALVINILTNPKGSRVVDITLADGSRVWLNAGSSISYPVAFAGKERKVSITGEAYFEVAKNASMPFRVDADGRAAINVLGTHFNINSYNNEPSLNATLLEGSVQVVNPDGEVVLKPGEQVSVTEKMTIDRHADLEKVMSWKNGRFNFENASLAEVMRQLERWYDIEVVYPNGVPDLKFGGDLSKDLSLKDLLEVLDLSGVKLSIEGGRRLIVRAN